jgi:transposase
LTKGQIEKLFKENVLHVSLFDEQISKVILDETNRYILKRNPTRATEISDNCKSKLSRLKEVINNQVHSRYNDLAKVEHAFRTCKTGHLEMRPIYVRKSSRTRGHVFVVMMSYLLIQKLRECWGGLDMTVEEGIERLKMLSTIRMQTNNITVQIIPKPPEDIEQLFTLANIPIPKVLPTNPNPNPTTLPTTKSKLNKKVSNKKIPKK